MDLVTVRDQFVKATGRRDLVTSAGANAGADWWIAQGQRWLDMRLTTPKTIARHSVKLAAGGFIVHAANLRSAQEVEFVNGDGRKKLERKSRDELFALYPNLLEDLDSDLQPPVLNVSANYQGTPAYWCPVSIALSPDQNYRVPPPGGDPFGFRLGLEGVLPGDHYNMGGMLILPPPDAEGYVHFWGMFWSPTLAQDTDKDYWTMVHPLALVLSAKALLQGSLNDAEGAGETRRELEEYLMGIRRDMAWEESAGTSIRSG
jgi:hypothetical protein